MGSGKGDNRARYRAGKASASAPNPSPPHSGSSADVRHEPLGASYDNEKAAERKVRRRRQLSSSIYFLPCLGAAVAVLILVLDVKWTAQERSLRRRAAARTITTTTTTAPGGDTAVVGSLGKTSHQSNGDGQKNLRKQQPQQGAIVADGATGALGTDIRDRNRAPRISHPPEVSVANLGFIDGRRALEVGNRYRSHTDSQGQTLSWWTKSRRYHDNYASDLNFDVPLDITFLDANNFRRRIQYEDHPLVPPLDLDARADPPEKN